MKRMKLLSATASIATCLLFAPASLLAQNTDCNKSIQKADFTTLNSSGLSGTAMLCIGDNGASANLRVEGTVPGHGYTAWFFYIEGASVVVNRFDSALAAQTSTIFSARVGGIAPASGSKIRLVVVDHGDLAGLTSFVRAQNVLTPAGKPFSAQVDFVQP
jgi:hypothetical protein